MGIQERSLHKAQFLPTSTLFSAVFNAITPGQYDFQNTPTCQDILVLELSPGTIYWIRRLSVGGNVPQEDYLGSIVTFPKLTVRRLSRPEAVYRFPIPIDKYIDNGDCDAWITNDRLADQMTLSLSGACLQLASMVGVGTLSINISLSIYAFNDQVLAAEFRGGVCK